jgi:hypothetical protein
MKYCLLLLLMLCLGSAFAQTDSLTIKLEQYKQLFIKGLITANEYEALKAKVLQINTPQTAADTTPAHAEKFNVSLTPVFYSDVAQVFKSTGFHASAPIRGTGSIGIHVLMGPAIKKQYHPNVGLGLEVWKDKIRVPLYADFGMKILKSRYSPYYHVSVGYMYVRTSEKGFQSVNSNMLLAGAGVGFNVYTDKNFAVALCADYRFLYNPVTAPSYNSLLPTNEEPIQALVPNFVHQAGLRLLLTCY